MSPPGAVDLLILGGGCAGLSLACELCRLDYPGRVIILEARKEYSNDRSWSFWSNPDRPIVRLAAASWSKWRFSSLDGATDTHAMPGVQYHYLPSDRFYSQACQTLDRHPNIELRMNAAVDQLRTVGQQFEVDCKGENIAAHAVVDCRPPDRSRAEQATLFQCFSGRIIQLQNPMDAAADAVDLMTGMRVDEGGFIFDYLLPISADRILVEATRFSAQVDSRARMNADLDAVIKRRSLEPLKVEHEEYGVLPMGLPASDATTVPNLVHAGTSAGALRPSTGYAFLRIQRWARACAHQINQGRGPCPHPKDPWLQGWMDSMFLKVMKNHPSRTPELFMALATQTPPDALCRFMSDKARFTDHLRVMKSLPLGLFLKELIRR